MFLSPEKRPRGHQLVLARNANIEEIYTSAKTQGKRYNPNGLWSLEVPQTHNKHTNIHKASRLSCVACMSSVYERETEAKPRVSPLKAPDPQRKGPTCDESARPCVGARLSSLPRVRWKASEACTDSRQSSTPAQAPYSMDRKVARPATKAPYLSNSTMSKSLDVLCRSVGWSARQTD